MSKIIQKISTLIAQLVELPQRIEDLQDAIGRLEMRQLAMVDSMALQEHEFKVSSQNGEDGIIQFLLKHIETPNKLFVEFGVHKYTESNTRFLMKHDNWSGLIIDGSQENIAYIKADPIYWRHNLKAECAFINRDNINQLIQKNGLTGDIGLLSVDIDGNDYWVWQAIECIQPRIVICEYNSLFGSQSKVSTPYNKDFVYSQAHYSTLYWGASISAFNYLARQKGYSLIGSNSSGNNIFFVRDDVIGSLPITTPEQGYVQSQFRTSRDLQGNLTHLDMASGIQLIADLPLCEVDTGKTITVKQATSIQATPAVESYAPA
jgi:hypothetical protein